MDSRINWLLLINAALGSFLAGTASRIFAVSLPTVARSLDTTIVGISWAVISFQISTISLSLIFGRIGDIYGRQKIFGLGFLISALGAGLCGLSQNVVQMILFRFFQVPRKICLPLRRDRRFYRTQRNSGRARWRGRHTAIDHVLQLVRVRRARKRHFERNLLGEIGVRKALVKGLHAGLSRTRLHRGINLVNLVFAN